MKVGHWPATVSDWGMYNEGTVFIDFRVQVPEGIETKRWFGSLKPSDTPGKRGAVDITVDSMARAGFNGDIDEFAKGSKGRAFDLVDIQLTIEEKEYQGKKDLKITGINWSGGTRLDEKAVKGQLTPLKAAFLAAKKAVAGEVKKASSLANLD